MIDVRQLRKSFGDVHAVQDVSFRAPDGEITGLLGPNGAGKTTTLRMLYGLLVPDAGTIRIDGHDPLTDIQAVQRSIGVLPDNRGLYKRLTARENIRYFGALHGLDNASLEERIAELVERLDLTEFIDRRTEGFSHGQRVKVAIARALVHDPRTLMLDEPTNGLDVMSTRAMRRSLLDLKDAGHCVLFSSHIMQEVAALCDRIVVIAHGRVVAAGTPDEMRSATGEDNLEDAFVKVIGSGEGLLA
jgi:sodium transport system ATP-binding protein